MSLPAHLAAGRAAEAAALATLRALGYDVLATNWRARGGELDLVAVEGTVLAIVEVRYRASDRFGGGAASVTPAKRRRIVRAARALLAQHPALARMPARFDVVEVTGPVDAPECRLIRAAFSI